ncbi:MAG: hypothetical protein M1821_006173 [Bathelium mastoideum]|nr:MAG: hypothetical protein M1821_006173 [Bathelium mastoideum]
MGEAPRPIESRSHVVFAVTATMVVLSFFFVFLRMTSRIAIVRRVSWDDYFMILAWIIALGISFTICYGTTIGLGMHEADVPPSSQRALQMSEYAFSVLYNPALMATKTSILVLYLSLSKTHKVFRWFSIGTLFIVNAAGFALTLLNVFQCRPVGAAFDVVPPASARCMDIISIYLSSSPVNISTDLAILFLPMPILTAMKLPRKQKVILVITFGFGVFVAAIDVIRIAYLQSAAMSRLTDITQAQHSSRMSERGDFSWYASLSYMWSAIEVNVGIMCGCVPGLKPVVSRFLPHLIRDVGETVRNLSHSGQSGSEHRDSAVEQQLAAISGALEQRKPSQPEAAVLQGGEPMGMMEFLTTPDMTEVPYMGRHRPSTATNTPRQASPAPSFFDFVNMRRKKSMVYMTNKESLFPIIMVTFLFLIWGFAYGLLDVLNSQFQIVARMTPGMTVGLHSAYYGGYFIAPITFGRLCLKYWGFKACYNVGLTIYAVGTLVFWPASVLTSFGALIVSNFIVGLGLSTLEISANAFITLCGPEQYGEIRLNLSQGVQAIGAIIAPLVASKALFHDFHDAPSLIDVQWVYLGIALFMVLLAFVYHYLPLPEATDSELADIAERSDDANDATIDIRITTKTTFKVKTLYITLFLAVVSQFCYVGGQEAIDTSFPSYLTLVDPKLNTVNHQAIGHSAFAVGRFIAAFLCYFIKPRWILLFSYFGTIVFSVLCMNFSGAAPATLVILLYLFEGPLFPQIFTSGLRGMGARTRTASTLLTAAIAGGGAFPPIMYAVQRSRGWQYAFCVVVAAFAAGALLPVWINANGKARKQNDHSKDESVRKRSSQYERRPSMSAHHHFSRPQWSEGRARRWSEKLRRWSLNHAADAVNGNLMGHGERRRGSSRVI